MRNPWRRVFWLARRKRVVWASERGLWRRPSSVAEPHTLCAGPGAADPARRAGLWAARFVARLVGLLAPFALACRTEPRALLELHQELAVRLPTGIIPSGAVLSDDGAFILWSESSSWVAEYRSGTVATLCATRAVKPVAVAFRVGDSTVAVVSQTSDSSTLEVLAARSGSPCSVEYQMPAERGVVSAARCGPGWVLGVRGALGHGYLLGFDSLGRRQWAASDSSAGSPLDASRATMAPARGGVVASSMAPPFRSAHVDCTGHVSVRFRAEAPSASAPGIWVGLRTLELENCYLQVLADPRSDRRRLLAFSTDGRVLRERDLNVAFGLLASSPDGRRLLALRRTDVDEVVRYSVLGGCAP